MHGLLWITISKSAPSKCYNNKTLHTQLQQTSGPIPTAAIGNYFLSLLACKKKKKKCNPVQFTIRKLTHLVSQRTIKDLQKFKHPIRYKILKKKKVTHLLFLIHDSEIQGIFIHVVQFLKTRPKAYDMKSNCQNRKVSLQCPLMLAGKITPIQEETKSSHIQYILSVKVSLCYTS